MPSRKPVLDERSAWTANLDPGPDSSVGISTNEAMNWDGSTSSGRPNEDRYYTCFYHNSIQLYMVLDGHDGIKAVNFSQGFIPHLLLQSDLGGGDKRVMEALRSAIVKTEREFFIGIDPYITRKVTLQLEIEQKAPEADSSMALKLFPSQIAEISRLDDLIKGGTTVVAALIYSNRLYVANVGDSRALLCSQARDGSLVAVQQLSVDHNTGNEEEIRRLEGCGLDPNALRRAKRLGMQQNTRSIGDYSIKGGYTSVDIISHATSEPGTAEPHLHPPVDLATAHGFLILMSDGLYEAYEAWTGRPERVNEDIAHLVAQELKMCADSRLVAQNVVDKVKTLYRDTCKRDRRSGRLDDITLVVKTLGRLLVRSQSTRTPYHHMHQNPHPQAYIPPTAPVTDKQFDFRGHDQFPSHHGHPAQQQSAEFPPGSFVRPNYSVHYRQEGPQGYYQPPPPQQQWRGELARPSWDQGYRTQEDYGRHYSTTTSMYPTGGPYAPQPNQARPYNQPPLHTQPSPHNQPPPLSQPMSQHPLPNPAHMRHDSDPVRRHDEYPYPGGTKPFTPLPVTKPYKVGGSEAAGGEFHTDSKLEKQEEQPPPVPPRLKSMYGDEKPAVKSTHADEEMRLMYGWSASNPAPRTQTTEPQTLDSRIQDPQTLESRVHEPQTLQNDPAPLNHQPPQPPPNKQPLPADKEPQSLQEGPPQAVGGEASDGPQTLELEVEEQDAHDDFIYLEDRDEIISSPEEEEEEEDPANKGSRTIKPYIRFTDRFPSDLSWDEIKIDPLSS